MKIALIGAGNLATHLGLALAENNQQIMQVFSLNIENAAALGSRLNCPYTIDLDAIVTDAELYILAVKDHAIQSIIETVNFKNHLVVHTSGSVPLSIFESHCNNYGVLYPLQTFSKGTKIEFSEIPILIEANSEESQLTLMNLAKTISDKVMSIKSEERLIIHLAAVFANNFVNHFYYIAEQLLKDNSLDFNILKSLIRETASKAISNSPEQVQTGPALRHEESVIESHLKILSQYPEWERFYQLISENIYNTHKPRNDVF